MLVTLTWFGCSKSGSGPSATGATSSDRAISPNRVGDYRIGASTLPEILGADTAANRRVFSEKGLEFEFNQGKELTAVTVSSQDYELKNGLRVGSTAEEVRDKLGEPKSSGSNVQPKPIAVDSLTYEDYTFLLNDSQRVVAIRIGH